VATTSVKITPYVEGVLTPAEAQIRTFTVPIAPTNLNLAVGPDIIYITWDEVVSAKFYKLRAFCCGDMILEKVLPSNAMVLRTNMAAFIGSVPYSNIEFRVSVCTEDILGLEASSIWTPIPDDAIFCKTYDDAIISGAAKIIRFRNSSGEHCYTKAYPDISETVNGTLDNVGYNLYSINDTDLSGTAKVIAVISDGSLCFLKVFPTVSSEVGVVSGLDLNFIFIPDATLSGTPRIAEIQINSIDHFLKVYPTKS
jgi:hypothetical protein